MHGAAMTKEASVSGPGTEPNPRLQAQLRRGQSLHAESRWPEAIEHWQWVCSQYPDESEPAAQLGLAWFGQGEIALAEQQLLTVRARFADHAWGHFGLGLMQETRHEWVDAIATFSAMLALAPHVLAVHEHLAHCLGRAGRTRDALTHLDRLLQLDPGNIAAKEQRAHLTAPRKGDVINALIQQFALQSFLEYNKFTGELVFDTVRCARKDRVFIPELSYRDAQAEARAKEAAGRYAGSAFLALDDLSAHVAQQRYDLIFFDPMHVRPQVDQGLKLLPQLLNPGGFLVVHDCNPEDIELTSKVRRPGKWLGETYKAFSLFHSHNPQRSLTVNSDFGVGVILNEGLELTYDHAPDIDYASVAADRRRHLGLTEWPDFLDRLHSNDRLAAVNARGDTPAKVHHAA
jgi:tetratricopeptide (TPR) repeat protein